MAHIMTKRGERDNIVVYEHYCDTKSDLKKIPTEYTTLGSIAIVLKGDNNGLEVYIADSNHKWLPLTSSIPSGGTDLSELHWYWDTGTGYLHMCDENNVDVMDPVWIGGGGGSDGGGAGYTEEDVVTTIYQDQALQFSEDHGFAYARIGTLSRLDTTKNATIIWNGESYICEPTVTEYGYVTYGGGVGVGEQGLDFTQYPFMLAIGINDLAQMYCSADNRGGHSVAIQQIEKHVTAVSNGFKEAVRDSFFLSFDIGREADVGEVVYRTSKELGVTRGDIMDMFQGKGGMVFMRSNKIEGDELLEKCRRMVSYSDFDGADIFRFEKENGVAVSMEYLWDAQTFKIGFYS